MMGQEMKSKKRGFARREKHGEKEILWVSSKFVNRIKFSLR